MVTAGLAFAVVWLVYVTVFRQGGSHPYSWRDATKRLGPVEFPRPTGRLFETSAALSAYLDAAAPGAVPELPPIDFGGREALLIATGPRSSSGYDLHVLRVTEERGRILVTLRELTPSLGQHVRAGVTSPYRLITFPRTDKPVYLNLQGRP